MSRRTTSAADRDFPFHLQILSETSRKDGPRSEGNLHDESFTLMPGEVRDWGNVRPIEP